LLNRDELLPALRALEEPLGEVERALEAGDVAALRAGLGRAAEWRRGLDAGRSVGRSACPATRASRIRRGRWPRSPGRGASCRGCGAVRTRRPPRARCRAPASRDYASPVASAQVKSALRLAALTGRVPVAVRAPYRSRDHTERLFVHLGLRLRVNGTAVSFTPTDPLASLGAGSSAVPPFHLV